MFVNTSNVHEEPTLPETEMVTDSITTSVEQKSEFQALPLPEGGLPEGWTQEQWAHYGHQYIDALSSRQ